MPYRDRDKQLEAQRRLTRLRWERLKETDPGGVQARREYQADWEAENRERRRTANTRGVRIRSRLKQADNNLRSLPALIDDLNTSQNEITDITD